MLKPRHKKSYDLLGLLAIVWLGMIVALSGPSWSRRAHIGYRHLPAYIIVLDLSTAMLQDDIAPSRLQRARFYIQDGIHALAPARFALVVFTGQAFTVLPLTEDVATLYHIPVIIQNA